MSKLVTLRVSRAAAIVIAKFAEALAHDQAGNVDQTVEKMAEITKFPEIEDITEEIKVAIDPDIWDEATDP